MEGHSSRLNASNLALNSSSHLVSTAVKLFSTCKIEPVSKIPEKSAPSRIVTSSGVAVGSVKVILFVVVALLMHRI